MKQASTVVQFHNIEIWQDAPEDDEELEPMSIFAEVGWEQLRTSATWHKEKERSKDSIYCPKIYMLRKCPVNLGCKTRDYTGVRRILVDQICKTQDAKLSSMKPNNLPSCRTSLDTAEIRRYIDT